MKSFRQVLSKLGEAGLSRERWVSEATLAIGESINVKLVSSLNDLFKIAYYIKISNWFSCLVEFKPV